MKSNYERKSLRHTHPISMKTITKMFLKVGKRRILLYILTGMVFFAIFTSIILVWNSYRIDLYQNFSKENTNWLNDQEYSISEEHYSSHLAVEQLNLTRNILEIIISKYKYQYYTILPENTITSTTGLIALRLYPAEGAPAYGLNFLDDNTNELLNNCLQEGRMPNNESELLYFREGVSETNPTIGDNFSLSVNKYSRRYSQNYTVVGIIENLTNEFILYNKSIDVLNWKKYLPVSVTHQFFTTANLFVEAVKQHPYTSLGFAIVVDFSYDWSVMNYRNMFKYQSQLEWKINKVAGDFVYEYGITTIRYGAFTWGSALLKKLFSFNNYWTRETIRIIAISLPILSLIFFTALESFNIDAQKLQTTFAILKKYGIKNKTMKKVLIFEGIITTGASFVTGFFIGIIMGIILTSVQKYQVEPSSFIGGLVLPLYWFSVCSFTLFLFLGGYLTEKALMKKTAFIPVSEPVKLHQKIASKLLAYPECKVLFPGILTTSLGILGIFLLQFMGFILVDTYSFYLSNLMIFVSLLFVGIILLSCSIFYFISRIITRGIAFLGDKVWLWKKNLVTLSLKNFSANYRDYKRFIFVLLVSLLCIIPGAVISKSYEDHHILESNLANGCSDLVVMDWTTNETILTELSLRENIEVATEVTLYKFSYTLGVVETTYITDYTIHILGIHNPEQFCQAIDYTKLGQVSYSLEHISALETDNSYLMSENYAKKNNYDKNTTLYNSQLSSTYYQFALTYVSYFEYFPLLPLQDKDILSNNRLVTYSLVTNYNTAKELAYTAKDITVTKSSFLLMKISAEEEIQPIKEDLKETYQLQFTLDEENTRPALDTYNNFILLLLQITTALTVFVLVFYSLFTSKIIFQQRMKIVETQYRLGANRKQIWWGFTIEILLITIIPISISIGLATTVLQLVDKYLVVKLFVYNQFALCVPWWLLVIITLMEFLAINGIWSIALIRPINQYRPIKQE